MSVLRRWGLGLAGAVLACSGAAAVPASSAPVQTLVAPPAKAAGPEVYLSPDGKTVYLIGVLSQGSFFKFDAVLLGAPQVERVYLASIGGLTVEARLIAALVRKRKLDTYVEYYCASACTQVFVAGRDRAIGTAAKLGFHQAVVIDKDGQAKGVRRATERKLSPTLVFGINGNDTLRLAYEQAGIDQVFIAKVLEQPNSKMWTPTTAELLEARVITRQASAGEVELPPSGISKAAIRTRLGQLGLWQQSARTLPDAYRQAADEVWLWANSGIPLEAAISAARTGLVDAALPRLLSASDPQLDAMLAFHARIAREQREAGYPLCGGESLVEARNADPRKLAVEREEDALLVGVLASAPAVAPPSRKEALDTFASEVMPAFAKAYRRGDAEGAKGTCRYSYRIYETLAALPADKRVKAYRAMLALPKFLSG